MKIAIPTRGSNVDGHFGHCEMYSVFTISKNNMIEDCENLLAPEGCGCQSNIAALLKQKGVTVLLAGNMGEGALQKIRLQGIQVVRGCTGDITKLVEAYVQGQLSDLPVGCHHQEGGCAH